MARFLVPVASMPTSTGKEGRPTSDVVLNLTYTAFDTTPESVQFFIGGFGPGAGGEYFDFVSSERTYEQFIGEGLFRVTDAFTFDVSAYEGLVVHIHYSTTVCVAILVDPYALGTTSTLNSKTIFLKYFEGKSLEISS